MTYRHVSSIFSEVTQNPSGMPFISPLRPPAEQGAPKPPGAAPEMVPATASGQGAVGAVGGGTPIGPPKRDDATWLSLCYTLLFFSVDPKLNVPYAFLELKKVSVVALDEENRVLTIVGATEPDEPGADAAATGGVSDSPPSAADRASAAPVCIVLLLPDGRWQELSLPKLELKLPSGAELQKWSTHLVAACQGRVPKQAAAPAIRGVAGVPMPPVHSGVAPAAGLRVGPPVFGPAVRGPLPDGARLH